MPAMSVILQGDECWPELAEIKKVIVPNENSIQIAILEMGMKSGRPSLVLRVDGPDGVPILIETSARNFCAAARIILAKFPRLLEG